MFHLNKSIRYLIIFALVAFMGISYSMQHYQNQQHIQKKSSGKNKINYDGYIKAKTFFADDYETLIRLSDGLQNNDKQLLAQLALEGKLHKVSQDTRVKIINTGLIDKNAVSIVFEEGPYDLKTGYTFKDWTSDFSSETSPNDQQSSHPAEGSEYKDGYMSKNTYYSASKGDLLAANHNLEINDQAGFDSLLSQHRITLLDKTISIKIGNETGNKTCKILVNDSPAYTFTEWARVH